MFPFNKGLPWSRALFEGVVIVASILLALAADAWWDGRQDRREEQQLLAGLEIEFATNLLQLDSVILNHQQAGVLVEELTAMADDALAMLPPDSVSRFILAMSQGRTFDPLRGRMEGVLGPGRLELIRDNALSVSLTAWDGWLQDAEEEAAAVSDATMQVVALFARHGGPYWPAPGLTPATSGDLAILRNDPELMERVRLKLFWANIYSVELSGLADVGAEVLAQIRANRR